MNIAFFLISKFEVAFLSPKSTVRQALEKMEHHGYTAIPLVDGEGKYAGTLTEGDLLRIFRKYPNYSFEDSSKLLVSDVTLQKKNTPVSISANMEDLFSLVSAQNFVPVLDDSGIFIGIIRRREVLQYFMKLYNEVNSRDSVNGLLLNMDK